MNTKLRSQTQSSGNADGKSSEGGANHWLVSAQYTQIAAVYDCEEDARTAAKQVLHDSNVKADQIKVINPLDKQFSKKLEGSGLSIGRSMWHTHLLCAGIGLVIGLLIAFVLVQWGPAFTQTNPLFTYIALVSPGLFIGLFIAGLIGLRPDRTQIIDTVKQAIRHQHYAVVVNLRKHQSVTKVSQILSRKSNNIVEAIQ